MLNEKTKSEINICSNIPTIQFRHRKKWYSTLDRDAHVYSSRSQLSDFTKGSDFHWGARTNDLGGTLKAQ